jgi:hypothetical protein
MEEGNKIIGKSTHFKLLDKLKSNNELFNHFTMGYGLNKRSIQLERIYNISKVKTCYDPLTLERLKIRAIFFNLPIVGKHIFCF